MGSAGGGGGGAGRTAAFGRATAALAVAVARGFAAAPTGAAAAAVAPATAPGIVSVCPQPGHFVRFPANWSAALKRFPQLQAMRMDISRFSAREKEMTTI